MLKYQHHICFNDGPKPCLSVSIDDRPSIKRHHPNYDSYTDLLSVQLLLFRVANCSPVHHLSHFTFTFSPFRSAKMFEEISHTDN